MGSSDRFVRLYLLAIVPIAFIELQYGWAWGIPAGTFPEAVLTVTLLGVLALFAVLAMIGMVQSEIEPLPHWRRVVLFGPVLLAVVAIAVFPIAPTPLRYLGRGLFWFSTATYVLVMIHLLAKRDMASQQQEAKH